MEYEFYIDVFFLVDLLFNLMALVLAGDVLRRQIRMPRLLAAAALGSIWNCVAVLVPVFSGGVLLVLTVTVAGSMMAAVVFGGAIRSRQGTLRQRMGMILPALAKEDAVLVIVSALISGCLTFSKEHFFLTDFESLAFAGCCTMAVHLGVRAAFRGAAVGRARYPVRLTYRGQTKEFVGLVDSGNRLRVPETGRPVSLISYADCRGFLESVTGGFYVPYRAVGTEGGMLFAVLLDEMEIVKERGSVVIRRPAVAIAKERLSVDGDFSVILPEDYV